ncbi:hypothetical protein [Roseovarius sp.]|jgi:hypothetical protein
MTRRWLFFVPLAALVAVAAGIGLLLGGRAVLTTETDVIEAVADRYLAEAGAGAERTDCQARIAQSDGLWLVVICEDAQGAGYEYFIDRFGRVADRKRLDGRA